MSVSKKMRFEVFKRDKFTCQYCGAKAPDAILHCDHIHPKSKGGADEVLNLVTACEDCNQGKGARLLDDSTVIDKQREQLEELQDRREQMGMMLEWRNELEELKADTVELICQRIEECGEFGVNKNGKSDIRRWLRRYSFDEILAAVDRSFETYMVWYGDEPDTDAWNKAFKKIPGVCSIMRQEVEKPYLQELLYVQGILRNRFYDKRGKYVQALEELIKDTPITPPMLRAIATKAENWEQFQDLVSRAWVELEMKGEATYGED